MAAVRIATALGLKNWKVGAGLGDVDGDGKPDPEVYVMYKLRPRKIHPEVGASPDGWIYGAGYDLNRDTSIDIFVQKDWALRGKPGWRLGMSTRF